MPSRSQQREQQFRLADEYLIDFNGKNAAIRAGYSAKSAARTACRILDMPHVQEHLTKARAAIAAKLDVSKERTLMEISRLAFSDIRKLFNEDGTLKKPHEYDGETAAFVSSIECDELFDGVGEAKIWTGYNKKVKLWDKVRALEMLAKHYGILKDDDPTDVKFNVIISGAGNKP